MLKNKIVQREDPILREKAEEVDLKKIKSAHIKSVIKRMKNALAHEEDGVAIAAPQIGESLRIFIVSGKVLFSISKSKRPKKDQTEPAAAKNDSHKDAVFINPEIIKLSKKKKMMEEGCLSVRWLYGEVERSEKVVIKAYDENGELIERGASGILAQIFQHETDHLNGVLFSDKAENLRDLPPKEKLKIAFFGGSRFSSFVLEELEEAGFSPTITVANAKEDLPIEELRKLEADVFIVASFGKILPKEIIEMPKHGTLNVHPSLLPELRGSSPIQNLILGHGTPGVTIMHIDEKMDHGPVLAQAQVKLDPWPDHYASAEEKLGRAGGLLASYTLSRIENGSIKEVPQNHELATYTKLIKKEDGLIDMAGQPEENLRKVLAFSTWPGAYMIYKRKDGKEIRIVVKDAQVRNGVFTPIRVVPAGKREMPWQDFLKGN